MPAQDNFNQPANPEPTPAIELHPENTPRILSEESGGSFSPSGFSKKAIFGVLAAIALTALLVFVVVQFMPEKKQEEAASREFQNPFEQTANPFSASRANPFAASTFQNPFAVLAAEDQEYQNPFENLR